MLTSLAPHITGDMDHGFFAAVRDEQEGVCATLGEFVGPGAVMWFWSANPCGTIGVFIDGQTKPVLKMPFADFLGGRFLPVREPYASITSLGHNLHFPIVHAKRCKLVLWAPQRKDLSELYYQIAWQSLPVGVEIHPFDISNLDKQADLLKLLGRRLEDGANTGNALPAAGTTNRVIACTLRPGQATGLLQDTGSRAITAIHFTDASKDDLQTLWLDDVSHPAWQGTGTEDYFGFAWCTRGIFQHPFRGQTRIAGSREHRIAHMHRYHILDQLPFRREGKFQFEAWGLGKNDMDWTTSILWYGITPED